MDHLGGPHNTFLHLKILVFTPILSARLGGVCLHCDFGISTERFRYISTLQVLIFGPFLEIKRQQSA